MGVWKLVEECVGRVGVCVEGLFVCFIDFFFRNIICIFVLFIYKKN